jgi:hypothetical protein
MLEGSELLSTVGVDYSPLRDLLASGQWKKADEETGAIMLKISGRVAAGWLREEDIETFPCDTVGWRSQQRYSLWYHDSELDFSLNAPTGHLPAAPFFRFCELAIGWTATLPSKLADCCVEDF